MRVRLTILICILMAVATHIYAARFLFQNGTSDYVIFIKPDCMPEEKIAAEELQYYLHQVSGVSLSIVNKPTANGCQIRLSAMNTEEEGFVYSCDGTQIDIKGLGRKGVIYGVCDFLESEFGILWLTPQFTSIPKKSSYVLRTAYKADKPFFSSRLDYYYDALHSYTWSLHNRINTAQTVVSSDINLCSWWGMHSMKDLIPESRYFSTHPEYFSLRNGKRQRNAQLCLSNPDVVALTIQALKDAITSNPSYKIYDVSQNDNHLFCQCNKCQQIANKYGGLTGLNIWFVNQVAKEIRRTFPDKLVGTFAYRDTRQPPTKIKPADNVAIRLSAFETCIVHGIAECSMNAEFMKELAAWAKITQHLYVWDYCVGFKQYLAPCPNFRSIAKRQQEYISYGVKGLLVEGNYEGTWGDFSELRQWVVAKLLWNPYQDVDSLTKTFIDSYYGIAASKILDYYFLVQNTVTSHTHFPIYADYKNSIYSRNFLNAATELTKEALDTARNDNVLKKKIKRVAAQAYYLKATCASQNSLREEAYKNLNEIVTTDPTYLMEYHKDLKTAFEIIKP